MMRAERTEIVVIGGGHNGLTCAAYLALAGREVTVLEARDEVGGCASTVDAIGARVNVCNCDHTMVLASGIVEDLGLASHGLRYLDVDPVQIAVSWSDAPVFVQWRSVERTLDGVPAAAKLRARWAARPRGDGYESKVDAVAPVRGLYLSGAATFPGAGVWGASGRNAARVALAARDGRASGD